MIRKLLFCLFFVVAVFSVYGEEDDDFGISFENPGSFLAVRELPKLRFTVGARVPMYSKSKGFGFAPQIVVYNREYGLYNYKKELVRNYLIAAVDFGGRVIYYRGVWHAYLGAEFLWSSCWDRSLVFDYEVPLWHHMIVSGVTYSTRSKPGFHTDGLDLSLSVNYAFQNIGCIRGDFTYEKEFARKADSKFGYWSLVNNANVKLSAIFGNNVTDYFLLHNSMGSMMRSGTGGSECYRMSVVLSDTLIVLFPDMVKDVFKPYFSLTLENGFGFFGECAFDDYPREAFRFGVCAEFGINILNLASALFKFVYTYPDSMSRNVSVFVIFDLM